MNQIALKNIDFNDIYNRSNRLATAVFAVSNLMDKDEDFKSKIKNLSLEIVYLSVNLKDINFVDGSEVFSEIEKKSLLLMSLLNIASISGLISSMNGDVLREEFKSFVSDIKTFADKFEDKKYGSIKNVFNQREYLTDAVLDNQKDIESVKTVERALNIGQNIHANFASDGVANNQFEAKKDGVNGNGHKRKDLRKNAILDFIKRHNEVGIKDIVPNVVGCSEKTVQRELISLINEGKIKKSGERRWSRYSVAL